MYTSIVRKAVLVRNLSRQPRLRRGFLLLLLTLALTRFALSPTAQAQLPPPAPDGGYPGNNTAEGSGALANRTTGSDNTAIGALALTTNDTGDENTAIGAFALLVNDARFNTAVGGHALSGNSFGTANTAIGAQALQSNTTASGNTAIGFNALQANTTGSSNTANGFDALFSNTIGSDNVANGLSALFSNTTGSANTATGREALFSNNGNHNTAIGAAALRRNTDGVENIATGSGALFKNTVGNFNTAIGVNALFNVTGDNNVAVGDQAGINLTTGSSNIDIGAFGSSGDSNTIRIGRQGLQNSTFIQGIFGNPMSGMVVVVNSSGKLGVTTSSARFKDNIKPMDKASEAILSLKPVTFRYKHELDPDGVPQFGLVAEQVEKVNPDLVVRDADGKINTVRYEAVNAMLLNEFLKEHRKVEEQQRKVQELEAAVVQQRNHFQATTEQQQKNFESKIAQQQKQIEALTAGLQKVSAQVELKKPAPQIVADNQ